LFVATKDIIADVPEPRTHTMTADSGNTIERAWCDECGCGLWIKPSTKPDMTFLKAGLFDPGEIPNPTMENWLKNIEPWEVGKRFQGPFDDTRSTDRDTDAC
jgi:hypothetical protein